MKSILKKATYLFLVVAMLFVNFFLPFNVDNVEAKTLRDLKEELLEAEKKSAAIKQEKKLTESQISEKKANIASINRQMNEIEQEQKELTNEINALNQSILDKKQEIKKIINYYQISNGENAYLEYIFEATDYTDFIYRMAIAEQLSNYNDKLIDEYYKLISENEAKKKELSQKTIEFQEYSRKLQKELEALGSQLGEITDENVTIDDDIKSLKKMIDLYENTYKCGLDENISNCSYGRLPAGTAFFRPVISGRIEADYMSPNYVGTGNKWAPHYGMDINRTGHGTNVYSVADGTVAYITERANCGGNMLYIWHIVNGVKYTSGYFHLASITVKVGDVVTTNTVVGTVGGDRSMEWWDSCSTGTHLHLQMALGNIPAGYGFYTKFTAARVDPRSVINFPAEGNTFANRIIKY